jgi:hypothetical protein
MQLEEIVKEASKLPESQRALIASRLLHDLETPYHGVSDEQVAERMREAEENPESLISLDEFVKGIRRSGT